MINVLLANKDKHERDQWRSELIRHGYQVVGECGDLSAFVYALAQEKVHFVMCATNLVERNAFVVLNAVTRFFPRVKIVIVGGMKFFDLSNVLKNVSNVIIRKNFETDIDRFFDERLTSDDTEKASPERQTAMLLDDHFLTPENAALVLGAARPKWRPGYAVISILTDSWHTKVYNCICNILKEAGQGDAVRMDAGEVCVIMDGEPGEELCLSIAKRIHAELMVNTDAVFSIGISRVRYLASELYACRNEARRAASTPYLHGKNSIVHIGWLGDNDIEYMYPDHKEKKLIELTMDGDSEGALQMLDEIFSVLRTRDLRQSLVNKIALGVLVRLNIAASARAGGLDRVQMDSISIGKLLGAQTIGDAYNFLRDGIIKFAGEMDAFMDLRRDVLYMELSKLKESGREITVSDLIRKFHTTVNFLNQSVAHNTGGNIFDYIGSGE